MADVDGSTLSDLISALNAIQGFGALIWILRTVGIVFIIYLVFMIVKSVLEYKRLSSLKDVKSTLDSIDHTLLRIEKKIKNKK